MKTLLRCTYSADACSFTIAVYCCLFIYAASFCGCSSGKSAKMDDLRFLPVVLEFQVNHHDDTVEQLIRERLMCGGCIFQEDSEGKSRYRMVIGYYRVIEPSKLFWVLLSGGMASVEADFSYGLEISLLNGGRKIKEYVYTKRQQEKTDSAFSGIFSPFSNGEKEELRVVNGFLDNFLEDVNEEAPLPFEQSGSP